MDQDVHLIYEAYGKSVIQEGPMDWLGDQAGRFRYGAQRGWRRGESDYTAPVDPAPVDPAPLDKFRMTPDQIAKAGAPGTAVPDVNGLPQFTHPVDFNQIKQVIDSKRIPEPALQYLYQSLAYYGEAYSLSTLNPDDKKLIEYIVSAVRRVKDVRARQQLIAAVQKYLTDYHLGRAAELDPTYDQQVTFDPIEHAERLLSRKLEDEEKVNHSDAWNNHQMILQKDLKGKVRWVKSSGKSIAPPG